jgi:uncharacterized protein with PQ loop repeat
VHHYSRKEFSTKASAMVNQMATPMALFGSAASIPQAWNVWILREVAGVSLLTFGFFLAGNIFWFAYGLYHLDKPIMYSNASNGLINALIVIGKLFM